MRHRKILKSALETLEKFGINSYDVIVTGSIGLDMHGLLPANRTPHDIDLIVLMNDRQWGELRLINDIQCEKSDYKHKNQVMISAKGIKLNIWRNTTGIPIGYLKDESGVSVKPIFEILNEKKNYARVKDYQDIINLAKYIMG